MRLFLEFLFAAASRNNLTHLIPCPRLGISFGSGVPRWSPPAPNFGYTPDPPRRAWRKWSLGLTALLLICLMWQCSSTLRQGRVLAEPAVQAFHAKLNAGKYEEIYQMEGQRQSVFQKVPMPTDCGAALPWPGRSYPPHSYVVLRLLRRPEQYFADERLWFLRHEHGHHMSHVF